MDDVDYIETVVRQERRGSSHGLSIRIARGVYYRPSAFRSRTIEWEETVHPDTGLLGFTNKHIYFPGPKKKFRVRYDRIVDLEPYDDGFGIMKDNQTAKPQAFRTGDSWFSYNLAVNLVVRNRCNDGLISPVPLPGHTASRQTVAEQLVIPPATSRMFVY